MNNVESLVRNKNNPVWINQPSRGTRGYDRFIVRWSQVLHWEVRYHFEGKLMVGTSGEAYYGFMDDFGSWIPFEDLLILTYA